MYRTKFLSELRGTSAEEKIAGWVLGGSDLPENARELVLRDPTKTEKIIIQSKSENILPGSFITIEGVFLPTEHKGISTSNPRIDIVVNGPPSEDDQDLIAGKSKPFDEMSRKRYLALRSPRFHENLKVVDHIVAVTSDVLRRNHFMYVDTPYLTRSVYEYSGNDFLVTTPFWQGGVAHLAQSPQFYKQLLMAGGIERYFQYARNFRAEIGDNTHIQEFTQIDAEMLTEDPAEIRRLMETVVVEVFDRVKNVRIETPFPVVNECDDLQQTKDEKDGPLFRWVVNAPLACQRRNGRITPSHHFMTLPVDPKAVMDAKKIEDMFHLPGTGYDLMYGDLEVAGGDLRITNAKLQKHVLNLFGVKENEIQNGFGALLEAMETGVPQHGGFAFGLNRLALTLTGETSLRDVIAFPTDIHAGTALNNIPFYPKENPGFVQRHVPTGKDFV